MGVNNLKGPGPGRPIGSKNKRIDLHSICEEVGLNVFREMVSLANKTIDPNERFMKLKDIAPYLYAKKKEIDLDVDLDLARKAEEYAAMPINEQLKLMKEEVTRIEQEIYYQDTQGPSKR